MIRKTLRVLVALTLVFVLVSAPALACPSVGRGFIVSSMNKAQNRAEKALYTMVDAANAKIARLVRVAQLTPYDDVDFLLWQVDCIVRPVYAYARIIGATVVCDYESYYIDGRWVLVDPLRVVNV